MQGKGPSKRVLLRPGVAGLAGRDISSTAVSVLQLLFDHTKGCNAGVLFFGFSLFFASLLLLYYIGIALYLPPSLPPYSWFNSIRIFLFILVHLKLTLSWLAAINFVFYFFQCHKSPPLSLTRHSISRCKSHSLAISQRARNVNITVIFPISHQPSSLPPHTTRSPLFFC